jgi:hypothetical protein
MTLNSSTSSNSVNFPLRKGNSIAFTVLAFITSGTPSTGLSETLALSEYPVIGESCTTYG